MDSTNCPKCGEEFLSSVKIPEGGVTILTCKNKHSWSQTTWGGKTRKPFAPKEVGE